MKEKHASSLDNAIRAKFGNDTDMPSNQVWNGIKLGIAENQLAKTAIQNKWLKGCSAVLLATVIALMATLIKIKKPGSVTLKEPSMAELLSSNTKFDTVYIKDTKYIYVSVPTQINTVKINIEKEDFKNTQNTELINNQAESTLDSSKVVAYIPKNEVTSKSMRPKILKSQTNGIEKNYTSIDDKELSYQKTDPSSEIKIFVPETKYDLKFDKLFSVIYDTSAIAFKLPTVNYKKRAQCEPEKNIKIKTPIFLNPSIRLSYAPQIAFVKTKNDGSQIAESIGGVKNMLSYAYGATINADINKNWSFETGIKYAYTQLKTVNSVKKRPIVAEYYEGVPQFLYRTNLGVAMIPLDKLEEKIIIGNNILVEAEEKHVLEQFKIPFIGKYRWFEGTRMFGEYTNRYSIYQVIGAEVKINSSQKFSAEVYEPNGHDFYTTFTSFKEVPPISLGLVFGAGINYNLSRKVNFFIEPTIKLSTSSYNRSSIASGKPHWLSFAFGFQYNLKK
jgi:hypothetical protein